MKKNNTGVRSPAIGPTIHVCDRRRFVVATATAVGACALSATTAVLGQAPATPGGALTKEARDRLTPGQVLESLKHGNERFRAGKMVVRDYRDQQRTSAAGQYPTAVILGCIDSRAPAE